MPDGGSDERTPSRVQRLVLRLMGSRAADAERQSREWFVICPNCGHERTYWDIGGVRYKARSTGERIGVRCPQCRERGMHAVEHRPGSGVQ